MPNWGAGCQSCAAFGSPEVILSGVSARTYSSDGVFSMDFLVPQASAPGLTDPASVNYYSGPVALQGTLTVGPNSQNFCGIAPGTYLINTTSPGIMSRLQYAGVTLQATGPGGVIQMYLQTPSLLITNSANGIVTQGGSNQMLMINWQVYIPAVNCPVHYLQ